MKKNRIIIMITVVASLAGCSSMDSPFDAMGVLPADGVIRVQQTGVSEASSRAGQTATYNNQNFGLTITNADNSSYSYNNVCMKYESGAWNSYASDAQGAVSQKMLWQNATQAVTLSAYSPYSASVQSDGTLSGSVQTDQTTDAAVLLSDQLWAVGKLSPTKNESGSITYNATDKALHVTFQHILSKVRVNVTFTDELPSSTSVSNILLKNAVTGWKTNIVNGGVEASGAGNIQMKQEATAAAGQQATFEAITVPTTARAYGIELTVGDKKFLSSCSLNVESNKIYTLHIRVGKEAVLVGEVNVTDWGGSGGSSDGSAVEPLITDPIFVAYLNTDKGVPVGSDGYIHPDNADVAAKLAAIEVINVYNKGVSSLEGIEYMKNLKVLNCQNNRLSSLNVDKNTNLTDLNCGYNSLTSLDVASNTKLTLLDCSANSLPSLNVDKNTNLTDLNCVYNSLTSLNVDKNTNLTALDCGYNSLTSLNVDKNTNLTALDCGNNRLSLLNVDKNTNLTALNCGYNSLKELKVANNTALTLLYCSKNSLKELDVKSNANLTVLVCNNNSLKELDVASNTALTLLNCTHNSLTSLNVANNTALTSLYCTHNSLKELNVANNTALTSLNCGDNSLTSLDIKSNAKLNDISCLRNQLSALDITHNSQISNVDCTSQKDPNGTQREIELTLTTGQYEKMKESLNVLSTGVKFNQVDNHTVIRLKKVRR